MGTETEMSGKRFLSGKIGTMLSWYEKGYSGKSKRCIERGEVSGNPG